MNGGDRRGFRLIAIYLVASCVACGSSGIDGGGRGTGIGTVTVQGNIAASGPTDPANSCPVVDARAVVSVRGTDVSADVAADCTFELLDVPPGDVTLDITTDGESNSLTINSVPPDTVVVLTDVRLQPDTAEVSGIDVRPADPAPVRNFAIIAEPPSGDAPLSVQFSFAPDPVGSTLVSWSFGDKSPSSDDFTPDHTYEAPGDYVVALTISEPGRDARQAYLVVRVTEPPPAEPLSVRLAARPQSGVPPLEVRFEASVFGAVAVQKVVWNFGDRSSTVTTTETGIFHTYERGGSFLAIVTVIDDLGREAGNSFPIVVERNAVAVRSTPTTTASPTPTATPKLNAAPTHTAVVPSPAATMATSTPAFTARQTPTDTARAPTSTVSAKETETARQTVRPTAVRTEVKVTVTAVPVTPRPTAPETKPPTPVPTRPVEATAISVPSPVPIFVTAVATQPRETATAAAEVTRTAAPVDTARPAETLPPTGTRRPTAVHTRPPTRVPTRVSQPTRAPVDPRR